MLKNLIFSVIPSYCSQLPESQPTWSQNAPIAIRQPRTPFNIACVKQLTLNISRIHVPIPDAMARDGNVVAHIASVEKPRADKLVAEESRLVLVDH